MGGEWWWQCSGYLPARVPSTDWAGEWGLVISIVYYIKISLTPCIFDGEVTVTFRGNISVQARDILPLWHAAVSPLQLGGIVKPNDGECHLDSEGISYTHSTLLDYPSVSQVLCCILQSQGRYATLWGSIAVFSLVIGLVWFGLVRFH